MKTGQKKIQVMFLLMTFFISHVCVSAERKFIFKQHIALSAMRGTASQPDTILLLAGKDNLTVHHVELHNDKNESFRLTDIRMPGRQDGQVIVTFHPAVNFIGITHATLLFYNKAGKLIHETTLTGLSSKGLEGENEPPLAQIVEALGYQVNLGWTSLSNHTRPAWQGNELGTALFRKAGKGRITLQPVARYSPDFELGFGYYTNLSNGPEKKQVGVLAKSSTWPQHQTLFPAIASGSTLFDPGNKPFGFFVTSPGHAAYSEDVWNRVYFPSHTAHATRIYPVKNKNGHVLKNTYLIGFEEAQNGDYNDYVFLVSNITPVNEDLFTPLFNGNNLHGWYTWLQGKGKNNDPDQNFHIENGALHVKGKDVGYVLTKKSYHNYHLTVDFKWGEEKWPPRENAKRDAGICYHIPETAPDMIWLPSIECQVQEGDVGDCWLIGYSTIEVDGKLNGPKDYALVVKKKDAEKPHGEWNTVEVIAWNGICMHVVNGELVHVGTNANPNKGRILLQSEYAEIYYRNIKIREL